MKHWDQASHTKTKYPGPLGLITQGHQSQADFIILVILNPLEAMR